MKRNETLTRDIITESKFAKSYDSFYPFFLMGTQEGPFFYRRRQASKTERRSNGEDIETTSNQV